MAYKCLSCTRPPEYCDVCTDYGCGKRPYDAEILRLAAEGKTDKQIAAELGLGLSTVAQYRVRNGFYKNKKRQNRKDKADGGNSNDTDR